MAPSRLIALFPLLSLFLSAFACAPSQLRPEEAKPVLEEAEKRLEAGDFDGTVLVLELPLPRLGEGQDAALGHLLIGKALFRKVELTLTSSGRIGSVMGILSAQEAAVLRKALNHFRLAAWYDRRRAISAEAHYLAGRTLDKDFLQLFEEAVEEYKNSFMADPNSPSGEKARERYLFLMERIIKMRDPSRPMAR